MEASDVLSALAFLLSLYATWKTLQFNDRQKSLIESQEKLNQRLLEKEEAELSAAKSADLGANIIKLGSHQHRLKVFNRGKCVARNVSVDFPDGNDLVVQSELDDKLPMEVLEVHQSVELIVSVHMGTKSKHSIRLRWSDDAKSENEKVVLLTL